MFQLYFIHTYTYIYMYLVILIYFYLHMYTYIYICIHWHKRIHRDLPAMLALSSFTCLIASA